MKRYLRRVLVSLGVLLGFAVMLPRYGVVNRAFAQSATAAASASALPKWFVQVWKQAQAAPVLSAILCGKIPATIPQNIVTVDATGTLATYQPAGAVVTAGNGFFSELGTNRRTCFSCHRPEAGWAMNPLTATATFLASLGTDPLFAPVDGANCPNSGAAAKTLVQKAAASSQLLSKGNIRIFLPVPTNAQYKVQVAKDPYGCENSAVYGLPSGVISMYRRVLSAANVSMNGQYADFTYTTISPQGAIMWDQREASLSSQFIDAALAHEQSLATPPANLVTGAVHGGVPFELGLLTAQAADFQAGSLTANGAYGGPVSLTNTAIGGTPLAPNAENFSPFTLYNAWTGSVTAAQASINRGQTIFNTQHFTINGVAGFNDINGPYFVGTCASCHDQLNIGSDALPGASHLGIGDNSSADQSGNQTTATALPPSSDQPLFTFLCPVGSIPYFSNPVTVSGVMYDEFQTTDPGVGLISGQCSDLGKFKVPRLRGLAARAPYFHGGNAATLADVVSFYNTRFNMELTAQQQQDLINFLNSL